MGGSDSSAHPCLLEEVFPLQSAVILGLGSRTSDRHNGELSLVGKIAQ